MCERQKRGEIEPEMNMVREAGVKKKKKEKKGKGKESHHTPLHLQTLIYNFNISNFHSSAHFPNVIFQFMSNRVTIFLNTAYDKLGGLADMQFRLSVLQAQQQTHWGVCVFIFISVCSVFWRGKDWERYTPGRNWIRCKICAFREQNHNSVINLIITVIIIRIMMVAMIMY